MPEPTETTALTGGISAWAAVQRDRYARRVTMLGRLWARTLLVTMLAVGVIAMHATPVPGDTDCHHHAASPPALDVTAGPDSHDGHVDAPAPCDPAGHHILAMCLAVLAGVVLLGLLAARCPRPGQLVKRTRESPTTPHRRPARPPPPSLARLAELCVMRC